MNKSKLGGIIIIIIVIFSAIFISKKIELNKLQFIKKSDPKVFSAVFLSNQQVYFGNILEENLNTMVLGNVYYLKANADLADASKSEAEAKLSLIKLGSELHGPKDTMIINRDHVLFFEEMTESGAIYKAIKENEK